MSWLDRVQESVIIQTGDGVEYTPQYIDAQMEEEFEMSSFNFRKVKGTRIDRGETKGRAFALKLFFQGDDHIEITETFRLSSHDRNPWKITHPFYDEIIVHPRRIKYDNRKYGVSEVTCLVLETIVGPFPLGGVSTEDDIEAQNEALNTTVADNYEDQTENITSSEAAIIENDVVDAEAINEGDIDLEDDKISLRNKVRAAQRAITNITSKAGAAIRAVQEVVELPARVIANVKSSVENLKSQFDTLISSVGNLTGLSKNNKIYVETQGANLLASSAIAAINNPSGYLSRSDVDDVTASVLDFYNSYLETLDSLETEDQTGLDSYSPSPDVVRGVNSIVNFTLSRLSEIALDSFQENVIINEADSNPIILAHRVYGLDDNDENLDKFIDTNNIGISEMLLIKKGREINYYS